MPVLKARPDPPPILETALLSILIRRPFCVCAVRTSNRRVRKAWFGGGEVEDGSPKSEGGGRFLLEWGCARAPLFFGGHGQLSVRNRPASVQCERGRKCVFFCVRFWCGKKVRSHKKRVATVLPRIAARIRVSVVSVYAYDKKVRNCGCLEIFSGRKNAGKIGEVRCCGASIVNRCGSYGDVRAGRVGHAPTTPAPQRVGAAQSGHESASPGRPLHPGPADQ